MAKTTIPAGGLSSDSVTAAKIVDGTLTSAKLDQDGAFTFNEEDVLYTRMNSSSGGPLQGQLSYGYKLNDFDSLGANLNIVFGSSRYTRNLIVDNENHLLQSRDYFSGSMIDLFYSFVFLCFLLNYQL